MKAIFEAHGGFFQQRPRAADESFEMVELGGRQVFLCIEKKFEQGWNYAHGGDLLLVQSPPEGHAVEFPIQNRAAFAIDRSRSAPHRGTGLLRRRGPWT